MEGDGIQLNSNGQGGRHSRRNKRRTNIEESATFRCESNDHGDTLKWSDGVKVMSYVEALEDPEEDRKSRQELIRKQREWINGMKKKVMNEMEMGRIEDEKVDERFDQLESESEANRKYLVDVRKYIAGVRDDSKSNWEMTSKSLDESARKCEQAAELREGTAKILQKVKILEARLEEELAKRGRKKRKNRGRKN